MRISLNLAGLKRTSFGEYALRFVLGGLMTACTGLVAEHFGPEVGGLFLAFPAIFPASATLLAKHETEKKRRAGIDCPVRGRKAAGLDAAGAVLGGVGLAAFAIITWRMLPAYRAWIGLAVALAAWILVSTTLWWLRKRHVRWAGRRHS